MCLEVIPVKGESSSLTKNLVSKLIRAKVEVKSRTLALCHQRISFDILFGGNLTLIVNLFETKF